ncbi:MAG: hypothetical protein IID52_02835 [Proteobacteria bacterium]|nr:hypothetical protein [Pseudomonadota bacterium]MCH8322315.1 hypothetical protein [Pseudomonadota bacterium]
MKIWIKIITLCSGLFVGFNFGLHNLVSAEEWQTRTYCDDTNVEKFDFTDPRGNTFTYNCKDFQSTLEFVSKSGNNKNFGIFLSQGAALTQTIQGLAATYGIEEVLTFVKFEVLKAMAKYGYYWDHNLAIVHLRYFSPEELHSILNLKSESPYFSDYLAKQDELGALMKEISEPILTTALYEVVFNTFEHTSVLPPLDPHSKKPI